MIEIAICTQVKIEKSNGMGKEKKPKVKKSTTRYGHLIFIRNWMKANWNSFLFQHPSLSLLLFFPFFFPIHSHFVVFIWLYCILYLLSGHPKWAEKHFHFDELVEIVQSTNAIDRNHLKKRSYMIFQIRIENILIRIKFK